MGLFSMDRVRRLAGGFETEITWISSSSSLFFLFGFDGPGRLTDVISIESSANIMGLSGAAAFRFPRGRGAVKEVLDISMGEESTMIICENVSKTTSGLEWTFSSRMTND